MSFNAYHTKPHTLPYTTLFRSTAEQVSEAEIALAKAEIGADGIGCEPASAVTLAGLKKLVKQGFVKPQETIVLILDRKSTRLNSSHVSISYAVFCLKKKITTLRVCRSRSVRSRPTNLCPSASSC